MLLVHAKENVFGRFKTPVIRCIEINVYQSINQSTYLEMIQLLFLDISDLVLIDSINLLNSTKVLICVHPSTSSLSSCFSSGLAEQGLYCYLFLFAFFGHQIFKLLETEISVTLRKVTVYRYLAELFSFIFMIRIFAMLPLKILIT